MNITGIVVTHYVLSQGRFVRPHVQKQIQTTTLPEDVNREYQDMGLAGWNIASEVLTTGEVSLTIEDPSSERDVSLHVVKDGPAVQLALVEMLKAREWEGPFDDD